MVKKILLILFVLAIAGFGGYLIYNTFALKSKQMQVEALPKAAVDASGAAQKLSLAVRFQTVSLAENAEPKAEEFQKFQQFLQETYPKTHSALTKENVGEHSILYTWRGSDENLKPIVLMAHQDVVPVDEASAQQWTHPPFAGDIADNFVWGRGTLDDKSSLMSIFETIEMLLNENYQPKRTIYLAFGHDEEIGGKRGGRQIAELLKQRNVKAEFVLDEGGSITDGVIKGVSAPVAVVGITEKGYLSLELSVEETGGHSSQPPKNTAIGILSRAITRLEDNPFPGGISGVTAQMFDKIAPEMNFGQRFFLANLPVFKPLVEYQLSNAPSTNAALRTTTAATVFNAGVKDNVLPNQATAIVNFRILPGETIETVTEHVRQSVGDERVKIAFYGENRWNPSPVSDVNAAQFQNVEKTIRQTFPETVVAPYLMLGASDSRYFTEISPNVYRFSPMKVNSEDLTRIHGINERISIETYARGIGFYYNLIKNSE